MSKAPSKQDLALKFDLEMANRIRMAMRLSQFRNAKTPVEKAKALNESGELIPISVACKAMSISTITFYLKKMMMIQNAMNHFINHPLNFSQ